MAMWLKKKPLISLCEERSNPAWSYPAAVAGNLESVKRRGENGEEMPLAKTAFLWRAASAYLSITRESDKAEAESPQAKWPKMKKPVQPINLR